MACEDGKMEAEGLSLEDGFKPLLDLRFADDVLLFYSALDKACLLLDELVASLARVGLTLNLKKTKILTTQTQPLQRLQTRGGVTGMFWTVLQLTNGSGVCSMLAVA